MFDENSQCIFMQVKNSHKNSVEITASLLLWCCLLYNWFLSFRLLCRCLLCCCHVVSTSYRNGLYFFLNLSTNKYLGHNTIFMHRIGVNNHFCFLLWHDQAKTNYLSDNLQNAQSCYKPPDSFKSEYLNKFINPSSVVSYKIQSMRCTNYNTVCHPPIEPQ